MVDKNLSINLASEFYFITLIGLTLTVAIFDLCIGGGSVLAAPNCPGGNHIVCENQLAGNPVSEWDVNGAGDPSIQGFTTDISVNLGQVVQFKIDTPSTNYRLDIYRMGYYAGAGARRVATVQPSASLPQSQPPCLRDATGLIDCGNWSVSASWQVPVDATSGIYFAKAIREDGANAGGASHIIFVVRDDSSTSDLLFQTTDTTWQAYNDYGGNSLYWGSGPGRGLSGSGRAYKVSYNRPMIVRSSVNIVSVFNAAYPMVRWLEANGYDTSYFSGIDSDRRGQLIRNHRVFLSVAHDEYWSGGQRLNVEAARDAGVNLGFFSGNEIFWKIRWENSIDGSGTGHRTMVCYKETHEGAKIDPMPGVWTGTWRDPRFSPPADGGRPENELSGVIFGVNGGSPASTDSIRVPEPYGKLRFWRNTSIATLSPGEETVLPFGTLGYEWDEDMDNGFRPAGLIRLSSTTVNNAPILLDFGSLFGSAPATHSLTLYRDLVGGGLVFGAGTVQWSWGLDSEHDNIGTPTSQAMRQATVNLFADMGVQPDTLQPGLVAAATGTDNSAPISAIDFPVDGSSVIPATSIRVSGTADDFEGRVGGVEVSFDGGVRWFAADGRENWTFDWTSPPNATNVTILSRATDDSLNLESPGSGNQVSVTLGSDTIPPTVITQNPGNGASGVGLNPVITVTFSEAMSAATINPSTFELRSNAGLVAATVDASGTTGSLTPLTSLQENTTYTITVRGGPGGVEDLAGNPMAANVSWQITTGTAGSSNCFGGTNTLWPETTIPTVPAAADDAAVELGVKFRADRDGLICGIRFYKAATNSGPHVGNLWTAGGQLLGSATFTNETGSGWQQVLFAQPVAISANTTFVASYHAPVGQYSVDQGYFAGSQQDSPPLQGLADGIDGGNGVFAYGPGGFPNNSFAASNYWVDVVFVANSGGGDSTPPVISSVSPADGATQVDPAVNVVAFFNEAIDSASLNGSTFVLRDSNNGVVAASVSTSGVNATLNPSQPLAPDTTYTATVRGGAGGVTDLAGNPLASDTSWQFTTAGGAVVLIDAGFNSGSDGFTYLDDAFRNTNQPAYASGTRLTSGGFSGGGLQVVLGGLNNTDILNMSGAWQSSFVLQQASSVSVSLRYNLSQAPNYESDEFSQVLLSINGSLQGSGSSDFIAQIVGNGNGGSARSTGWQVFETNIGELPPGQYTLRIGGFNNKKTLNDESTDIRIDDVQVIADPQALPVDSVPPVVTSVSPIANATGIPQDGAVTASFSEAMDPATIASATFELQNSAGASVAASVSYSGLVATLNPSNPLAAGETYTATVRGGPTGVTDLAGNPLAADRIWQFSVTSAEIVLIEAGFENDTAGFTYIDDAFRNTNQPNYARGTRLAGGGFNGAGLQVVAGGINNADILNMSGGWQRTFVLSEPTEITISTRYNLTQTSDYESDEISQMLMSVDGVLIGVGSSDFIAQITGNGNGGSARSTGWRLFETNIGVLAPGQHRIVIGGFNNKKTLRNESTEFRIDDVRVSGIVSP